jgi:hypothetical protein
MRNAAEKFSSCISEIWFGLAISGKARQFMPLDERAILIFGTFRTNVR